ncbi:unnamed protein product [Allacma fusca]|uniref:Uncharacterized protein n=1 Tax=Allacma fusca TaxID=39272 RepID=A0A8J2P061_9HEXA|nr:unnamed protein product [Allacma fusca]
MNYSSEDGSSILNKGNDNEDSVNNTSDRVAPESIKQDYTLLERFHEDALQQVGHGKVQWILFLVCGLVMAADLSELLAVIMSAKSAQFEFCVDDSQKSWLVGATLMGMGVGAIFWGFVGDRVGRRRALIYCLGVGSIFGGASVIMPTEGTFITARIFSGVGLGGCLPLAVTYFAEFIQEKRRRLAISLLFLFWPVGAGLTLLSTWFILPENGFHLSEELKEHFSAWRRLLLAAAAPTLVSLVALIFMPEAPLTLMKNGRDAESLNVYKRIHKCNRGSRATFCFSEIEIPAIHPGPFSSPSNVLGDLSRAIERIWASFLALWTENRRKLTLRLTFIWFFASMGSGALSSWALSQQATLRDWTFDNKAKFIENESFNHSNISSDLINVRYQYSQFEDVSIQNVMMNHVKFENCTFQQVNFTNVKASYVLFIHSELTDCFFLDTDLGRSNFQNCRLENITYAGLNPTCHLIPDFNMQLSSDMIDSGLPVLGIFFGTLLAAILMTMFSRSILTVIVLFIATLVSIGLAIWPLDATWTLVGHTISNAMIAAMWSALVTTYDKYPFWIRGGALGFCCAGGRIGSFFGVGLFGTTLHGITSDDIMALLLGYFRNKISTRWILFRSQISTRIFTHPSLQVPLMFWTDHDCYLLMELARASPEIIDNLPRLEVASDPSSTDFFYERLKDIAQTAKMEQAIGGGNYAVIRKFPEDISQKLPMPSHAPGQQSWKRQCSSSGPDSLRNATMCGLKQNYWPTTQNRLVRSTNSAFLPTFAPVPSVYSINETVGTELSGAPKPPPLSEDFLKSQDEFFMAPPRKIPSNSSISNWTELEYIPPQPATSLFTSSLKVNLDNDSNWMPSSNSLQSSNTGSSTQSSNGWTRSNSTHTVDNSMTAEFMQRGSTSSSCCVQGRYWPKQMHPKDCNNYEAQAPKMGQVYPTFVRSTKPTTACKNNYHCRVHNDDSSESNSPPSTPKENYLCVFCKGNNEPEAIYKSHPLRLNNIVICPSLRNYTCCICKATGDNAHTIKYCPFNKRGFFATRSHEKCNSNNNSRIKMKVQIIEEMNGNSRSPTSEQGQECELFHQRNFQPISMIYDGSPEIDDDNIDMETNHCLDDSSDEDYEKLIISVEKPSGCRYSRC